MQKVYTSYESKAKKGRSIFFVIFEVIIGTVYLYVSKSVTLGAQWLSGRVLDSRPKGRGFEPHRRHCVVVLEQDTFIPA